MDITDFQELNHVYYQGHVAMIQSIRGDFYTISFDDNGETRTAEVTKEQLKAIPLINLKINDQTVTFGKTNQNQTPVYEIRVEQNRSGLWNISSRTQVTDVSSFHTLENFIRENTGPSGNGHVIGCEKGIIK